MPQNAHSRASAALITPRYKVLIVDDELPVLLVLKRTLRKRFDIEVALNANHALELLENKGPFAVIVSDMRMPQIDGATFLARARQISPDTSRIMMSGDANRNTALKAVNQGRVFCFLDKPCSAMDVANAIMEGAAEFDKKQAPDLLTGRLIQRFQDQLHTPLSEILNHAQLIRDGVLPGESVREFSDLIATQASDLLTIAETLADLTAIQENRLVPELQRIELDAIAQQALRPLRRIIMAKGLEMTITSEAGVRPLMADPRLIRRSLEAIFSNAIRFSDTGKSVLVNIRPAGEDAAHMVVEVTDSSTEVQSELHTQSRSAHLSLQEDMLSPVSGIGLGLPFARAVFEMHQGYMELHNNPGEGTVVRLFLPVTPPAKIH